MTTQRATQLTSNREEKVITYAYITRKLKEGRTLDELIQESRVSKEEFFEKLKKNLCKRAYEELRRELKKSDKNRIQKSMRKKTFGGEDKEIIDSIEKNIEEEEDLQFLKKQEEKLKNDISNNENQRMQMLEDREGCINRLKKEHQLIEELHAQLEKKEQRVNKLQKDIKAIDNRIASKDSEKANFTKQLEQVQAKIYELDFAEIKINSDGTIESEIELIAELWQEKFNHLTSEDVSFEDFQMHELAEELTVKQLKLFSKILTLADGFDSQNRKYKLLFDKETEVANVCELLDMDVEYLTKA